LSGDLRAGDILLINTGYYKKFRDADYYETYPEITEAFAREAVRLGVSMVGMDTPSPDRAPYLIHRILLGSDVLIIENLNNLDALKDIGAFEVFAFPVKIDIEAAQVRVVARVQ
jgi:kynurenine formamidase